MLKINFSHEYSKMEYNEERKIPKKAILMEVFKIDSRDLHPRFIEYDTSYFDKEKNNWAYYKLPEKEVIVLLLKTNEMIWTTIRRFTPKKFEYYRKNRWQEFKIFITKSPSIVEKTREIAKLEEKKPHTERRKRT